METCEILAGETGFKIKGYTEFGDGSTVIGYLENPNPGLLGQWTQDNYMLHGNSFDRTTSAYFGASSDMHRCTNQFANITKHMRIRHSKAMYARISDARKHITQYQDINKRLEDKIGFWSGIEIDEPQIEEFVIGTLALKKDEREKWTAGDVNKFDGLSKSINKEIIDIGRTAFGLFNGATHYSTHVIAGARVFGNVLGSAAKLNNKAVATLEEMFSN